MTKKLFGEYLVEKKLISSAQLLEILMDQLAALPTLPELLHQKRLMSDDDLLRALSHQSSSDTDFKGACTALGLWTPSLQASIASHLLEIRIPIGQLLVQKGHLTLATLTKALDEYFSDERAPLAASSPAPSADNDDDFFTDAKRERLAHLFTELGTCTAKSPPDLVRQILQSSHQLVHSLRGAARLAGNVPLENSWALFERELSALMLNAEASPHLRPASSALLAALEHVWALRNTSNFSEPSRDAVKQILGGQDAT